MARPTHVYTIEYVATLIGENLELLEEIASNSDNIDYGEMIHVYDGTDEGSTTFTDRGIETCRSSLPTCAPGKAAFANSFSTSNVIRKRSNASWQMSQNHKPRGLGRMVTEGRDPRIVHAHTGYGITSNAFALVLKETNHAALLMALPRIEISGDGQMGWERPALDDRAFARLAADTVWRVKRTVDDGRISYRDGRHLFHTWDGQAVHFNIAD